MGYLDSRRFDLYSNYQITSPNLETPMATRPKKYTLETICQEIDKFRPVPCPDEILDLLPESWNFISRDELRAGYWGQTPQYNNKIGETIKSPLFDFLRFSSSEIMGHHFTFHHPDLTKLIIKLYVRK